MTISDPITLRYEEKRGTYILVQGNETFFDQDDCMLEWVDPENAAIWLKEHYPDKELVWPKDLKEYLEDMRTGNISGKIPSSHDNQQQLSLFEI